MAVIRSGYGCIVSGLLLIAGYYGFSKWDEGRTKARNEAVAAENRAYQDSLRPTRRFYRILVQDEDDLLVYVDALYQNRGGYLVKWPFGNESGTKRIHVWSIPLRHIKSPDDLRIFLNSATEKIVSMTEALRGMDRYELEEAAKSPFMELQKTGNTYQEGNRDAPVRAYYSLAYPYAGRRF